MRKRIGAALLTIVAVQAIAYLVGQIFSRRLTRGDESSDDFQIAAICGGKEFHSRAHALQSGSVIATMGGIDLDLREAVLDPAGATLDLNATMGGIQVTVPDDWAVDVAAENVAGGFDTKVTPAEDLPPDAPRLHIHAVTRMGGGQVITG